MTQLNFYVCRVREKKVIQIYFFDRLTLSLVGKYGFYEIKKTTFQIWMKLCMTLLYNLRNIWKVLKQWFDTYELSYLLMYMKLRRCGNVATIQHEEKNRRSNGDVYILYILFVLLHNVATSKHHIVKCVNSLAWLGKFLRYYLKPVVTYYYIQRMDERSLKLRTERRPGSLVAESPWTEQANVRTHAGHIRRLVSGTLEHATPPPPPSNPHFLLIICAIYLVENICSMYFWVHSAM